MESTVASQISPQIYSAKLAKLYEGDIDVESELFEINIFNTTLHIAPGKSIAGDDGLIYFYVYAIKDEKVLANLGVYELIADEQKTIYDISTFENLLLFDYYYTNSGKIKEFEITGKDNIFDYIKTHLEFDKERTIKIYSDFLTFVKEIKTNPEYDEAYKLYKKIFAILGKDIREKGIDKEKIDQLKEKCKTDMQLFKLTLATLEPFLNVHFSFVDNGATVSNARNKTPPQKFTPTQYILVSMDQSFLSTASTTAEGGQAEEGQADGLPLTLELAEKDPFTQVTEETEATATGTGETEKSGIGETATEETATEKSGTLTPVSKGKKIAFSNAGKLPPPRVKTVLSSALSAINEGTHESASGTTKVKLTSESKAEEKPKESKESKTQAKSKGKPGKTPEPIASVLPPPPPKVSVKPGILSSSASRVESKLANENSNNEAKPTKPSVSVVSTSVAEPKSNAKPGPQSKSQSKKSFTSEA